MAALTSFADHAVFDADAIALGRDAGRRPVCLSTKTRLQHLFVLGASDSGKSRFITAYAKQVISNGEGLLLLDPHGGHLDSPFHTLIPWLQERGKTVHVIDFTSEHVVGFNPLFCPPGTEPSVIAANVMDALSVAWEDESLAQRPTIERVMRGVLIALIECNWTICEAGALYSQNDELGVRRWAIEHIKSEYAQQVLRSLEKLARDGRRPRDFEQEIVGPHNRLQRLLSNTRVKTLLGQQHHSIDLAAAMDRGEVILVNLMGSPAIHETEADIFGRLLLGNVLFHAKRRTNYRPFTVICDEAARFLFKGVPSLLGEVRKFGVSVVAALQWLAQAERDPNVLAALLNVNTRIIFRTKEAEDAERIARTSVPIDLERPVKALTRPTVVGHRRIRLINHSESNNRSHTDGSSQANTEGWADTEGETRSKSRTDHSSITKSVMYSETDSDFHSETSTEGESESEIALPVELLESPHVTRNVSGKSTSIAKGRSRGHAETVAYGLAESSGSADTTSQAYSKAHTKSGATSRARSQSDTAGEGSSRGHAEALEPILEDRASAVHSLQNELYRAGVMLRSLPSGVALLNTTTKQGEIISTLFQVPYVLTGTADEGEFVEARTALLTASGTALPFAEAEQVIAERKATLAALAQPRVPRKATRKTFDDPEQGEAW